MNQTEKTIEEVDKIDLMTLFMDFFRTFRRMWLYVLVLALIGGLVMGLRENSGYQAYYTASATFTINIRDEQQDGTNSSSSFFDNAAAEQMATTFPNILMSGVLQRKVANELGMAGVPGSIKASVLSSTNLLTLSVRDTDPERAYQTLQAVINNYPSVSEVIVGKVNMKMLDESGVPTHPDNSKNLSSGVKKGAVLGAGLGFGWIVLVTLLRKTIRRKEDCQRYINQRCLGGIPLVRFKERSKRIEHRLNIAEENVGSEFKEAIRMVRNKLEKSARDNSLKTILVTSALAGEGKSTIAVNLAISMAQQGKKVALIDGDLRNPSDNLILKTEVNKGLVEFLKGQAELEECICNVSLQGVMEKIEFLFVPGGAAVSDGAVVLENEKMQQLLDVLEDQVDYIILDSAPVGLLTDAGVLAQYADGALFVVKQDFAKADYILRGLEHLADSNVYMVGCVLNGN